MGLQKLRFLESSSFRLALWNFATRSLFSPDLEEGSTCPGNLGMSPAVEDQSTGCCGVPFFWYSFGDDEQNNFWGLDKETDAFTTSKRCWPLCV